MWTPSPVGEYRCRSAPALAGVPCGKTGIYWCARAVCALQGICIHGLWEMSNPLTVHGMAKCSMGSLHTTFPCCSGHQVSVSLERLSTGAFHRAGRWSPLQSIEEDRFPNRTGVDHDLQCADGLEWSEELPVFRLRIRPLLDTQ